MSPVASSCGIERRFRKRALVSLRKFHFI
jgi:hypothetical protein